MRDSTVIIDLVEETTPNQLVSDPKTKRLLTASDGVGLILGVAGFPAALASFILIQSGWRGWPEFAVAAGTSCLLSLYLHLLMKVIAFRNRLFASESLRRINDLLSPLICLSLAVVGIVLAAAIRYQLFFDTLFGIPRSAAEVASLVFIFGAAAFPIAAWWVSRCTKSPGTDLRKAGEK